LKEKKKLQNISKMKIECYLFKLGKKNCKEMRRKLYDWVFEDYEEWVSVKKKRRGAYSLGLGRRKHILGFRRD